MTYNPEKTLPAAQWLATDETERIAMVESWHRRAGIRVPGAKTHAIIHAIVENQIALGESAIVESLSRLCAEGLSRHDAIHAIGSVLAEQMFNALKGETPVSPDVFYNRVRGLSAAEWLRSGSSS